MKMSSNLTDICFFCILPVRYAQRMIYTQTIIFLKDIAMLGDSDYEYQ